MTKTKSTKRALLSSALALFLCFSMLLGTTFAWFTDEVTSAGNMIMAGSLQIDLLHKIGANEWKSLDENPDHKIFNYDRWEPGYTRVEVLKAENLGSLALQYKLSLTFEEGSATLGANGENLADVIGVYVSYGEYTDASYAEIKTNSKWSYKGTLTEVMASPLSFIGGELLPEGKTLEANSAVSTAEKEQTVSIALHMDEEAGNGYQKLSLGNVYVTLTATQWSYENDAFGSDYDQNAAADFYAGFQGGSAGAAVNSDADGKTTEEVTMDGGDVSAVIPTGVQVADGTTSLKLDVTLKTDSESNIQLAENEKMRPVDVHIEGVAQGNTVPMLITLKHYLTTGINTGAIKMYHVENGVSVPMTHVVNPVNHNEFSYDPLTGDVTLALASFSEVAIIADTANTWNGEPQPFTQDTNGNYLIGNASQLAYFRDVVDGKTVVEGIDPTFVGKTVKLTSNIYLSKVNFDPIGWGYVNNKWNRDGADGKVFQGTFDGNGMTILDLLQNGWDLEAEIDDADYTYTNCGFGLFAAASGATFKDLTISGADIKTECVEMGVLVGLSQNSCTYQNIKILTSKIANYQRPAGGLIGEVSGDGTTTITDVIIGSDVVVGSLWGDFDAPVGGVIGAYWNDVDADPQIYMTNVDVGCRLDVYNDITSAYQWHAYRRAGMLIGNTDMSDPNNAHKAYAPFLHCDKVRVYYGDWVDYHYCQFDNQTDAQGNTLWNSNYPWVRVEAGENCSAYSNPRYGQPVINGVTVTTHEQGVCTGEHEMVRQFSQLYGGGQGVYGQDKHDGVTYPEKAYSITYVNDGKTLDIVYVTDNKNSYEVGSDQAKKLVDEWATENMKDYNGYSFGGWMTAASVKLDKIPANNTQNIVLYPYFTSPHTASFVDVDSNVLAWCFFNEVNIENLPATFAAAKVNLPSPGDDYELLCWVVRGTDKDGKTVNVQLADNNDNWDSFKSYKDVTITPKYRYKGADLIEVYDELTGEIDHYQVAGYAGGIGSTIVEIPAYVNGKPVTTVNADAFSSYDDLHSVVIPGTITTISHQSFTADNPDKWGEQRDTVTLYYEGDPAVWNAAMNDYNNKVFNDNSLLKSGWDNMMGESSCVFFLDENGKVDLSKGYWELAKTGGFIGIGSKFVWQHHNHEYGSNNGCSNEHNNKTVYTDQCDCDLGKHDRPDAKYWN